jgi:methanogenic corrinoid protein MtbC1
LGKEELLDKLTETIIDGDIKAATEVVQEVLAVGIDPSEALTGKKFTGQRVITCNRSIKK